ncbi:MAG: outer membrane lipoprotein chaperone LolA [Gemmatimonadota bacterium]
MRLPLAAPRTPVLVALAVVALVAPPTERLRAEAVTHGRVEAPRGQDPDAIARRADEALAALRSLRASFVQEVQNPLLEKTTTGRGTILYRAPDRYRIAYNDPAGDLVVNDGTRVWIYLPSSQPGQVIRQPAQETGVRNPLMYLRDLRDRYAVRYVGVETVSGHSADKLDLTPRGQGAPFAAVEAWVDRDTGLLRRVRTRAEDGVVTTYTFTTLERNVRLNDTLFRFAPPRGVEVFDS